MKIMSDSGDSRGIQTHNLLIRSQMLYSVELGSRSAFLQKRVQRYGVLLKQPNKFLTFFKKSCLYYAYQGFV